VKVTGLAIAAAAAGIESADPVLADTRGLGRVLYAALTGYWPGAEQTTLPAAPRRGDHAPSPCQVRPGIPGKLGAVACRALSEAAADMGPPIVDPAQLARELVHATGGFSPRCGPAAPHLPDPAGQHTARLDTAQCSGSVHGQRAGRIVRDRRRRHYRPRRKNTPVLPRRTSAPVTARPRRDPHPARPGEGPATGLEAGGRPERVVIFVPGSFLVLFTDGLVERRGEIIDTGFARLGTAFTAAATLDPVNLCEALIEQSLPHTGRNDDTAILRAFLA
jgi:Stage II sporulation protein E (SpoIIE)